MMLTRCLIDSWHAHGSFLDSFGLIEPFVLTKCMFISFSLVILLSFIILIWNILADIIY